MRNVTFALLTIGVGLLPASAQSIREAWSKRVEPFHVIGNIYYVGASGVSAHIIDTSDGLILVDTGTDLMIGPIEQNLEKLGFAVEDIEYIVSSHAHWDHVEGHAALQEKSGATIVAMEGDAKAIATGTDLSALGSEGWEPATVGRTITHGDTLTLGETTLTAHHTPGHTPGCTTWTMTTEENGETYEVLFLGGTSVNLGVNLLNNERHPDIAEDYRTTFERLWALHPDVFLAQHPMLYDMHKKRAQKAEGGPNPFINPDEYREFIATQRHDFERKLARDRKRAGE